MNTKGRKRDKGLPKTRTLLHEPGRAARRPQAHAKQQRQLLALRARGLHRSSTGVAGARAPDRSGSKPEHSKKSEGSPHSNHGRPDADRGRKASGPLSERLSACSANAGRSNHRCGTLEPPLQGAPRHGGGEGVSALPSRHERLQTQAPTAREEAHWRARAAAEPRAAEGGAERCAGRSPHLEPEACRCGGGAGVDALPGGLDRLPNTCAYRTREVTRARAVATLALFAPHRAARSNARRPGEISPRTR